MDMYVWSMTYQPRGFGDRRTFSFQVDAGSEVEAREKAREMVRQFREEREIATLEDITVNGQPLSKSEFLG